MAKKFYWLKLQKDFFKRHDIRIIEAMPNGKDYILFYLKLLLESISHDGELRFSETIPYNEEMLATITDTNIDIVRNAMKIFIELNMVEILDDMTIFMAETQKLIGCETSTAERVRNYREKQKALHCNTDVTNCNANAEHCNTEIEIEKELDIEKEIDITSTSVDYQCIANYFNSICVSFPKVQMISAARKKAIKARLNNGYTYSDFEKLFKLAENSEFLKGKNNRDWQATFDWLTKDANMAKVLDGNYNDKAVIEDKPAKDGEYW